MGLLQKAKEMEKRQLPEPPVPDECFRDKWDSMGLKSRIEFLAEKHLEDVKKSEDKEKKKKGRFFKLPFKIRFGANKLAKGGKVLVLYLHTNRAAKFRIEKVTNGMVWIAGVSHNADPKFFYIYKKNIPILVIHEDRINPVSAFDERETGDDTKPARIILRAIESKEVGMGGKMDSKILIIGFVVAIIVGYVLFNQ